MIKQWFVTGDTHGRVYERLQWLDGNPAETAIIILGDVGFNFYLNSIDSEQKSLCQSTGYRIYCVRGNHEERPENISTMLRVYDGNVYGEVYVEEPYPNIRYFIDGNTYQINGHSVLVIGGAYSVDKEYRLRKYRGMKWVSWFESEQLTEAEMSQISEKYAGKNFDLIFSHTCPYSWQPFDLFIGGVDQSKVDHTMEKWLDEFKDTVTWGVWLFGHFHSDRRVRSNAIMYYRGIERLEDAYNYGIGKEE